MSKEFDVYNPGSWVFADEEKMTYLGFNLLDPSDGTNFTQENVALLLNEIICKKGLTFTKDSEFRDFVNHFLALLLDNTNNYLDKISSSENREISPEMSGVIVGGHELSLAQFTYFFGLCKFEKDQIEALISLYYNGILEKKNDQKIRQNFLSAVSNCDPDFIFSVMDAKSYSEEVSTFVDFLFGWVSECETVEDVEKIFNFPYFEKHPEIKNSILEDNLFFGIENNKIFRKNP